MNFEDNDENDDVDGIEDISDYIESKSNAQKDPNKPKYVTKPIPPNRLMPDMNNDIRAIYEGSIGTAEKAHISDIETDADEHEALHKSLLGASKRPDVSRLLEFHGSRLEPKYGKLVDEAGNCTMCNKPF